MTPTFAGLFAAGVLTFGTPCVLPLVPIYLSVLLGAAIAPSTSINRLALVSRALFFSLGFVTVFSLLGVGASALGQLLIRYQQVLQITGGLVILLFALKFLGLLNIPLLDRSLKADDSLFRRQLGPIGAFGMGLVFALGWSPCVGPMLGAVLTYTASTTADPWRGAAYLATYGAGFAVPLLLVALFAQAGIRTVRGLNRHLPRLQQLSGALLLVVGLLMIYGDATGGASLDPGFKLSDQQPAPAQLPIGKGRALMVEFFKDDCPICKKMAPIVAALKSECEAHQLPVLQVNLSKPENQRYISQFGLRGVPTFLAYDAEGQLQARLVGEQTVSSLERTLSSLSGEACVTGLGDTEALSPAPSDAACEAEDGACAL